MFRDFFWLARHHTNSIALATDVASAIDIYTYFHKLPHSPRLEPAADGLTSPPTGILLLSFKIKFSTVNSTVTVTGLKYSFFILHRFFWTVAKTRKGLTTNPICF